MLKKIITGSFALCSSFLMALDEQAAAKRIYAHLFIHDPVSAVAEAKKSLALFPESKQLHFALIRALCESGEEVDALDHWQKTLSIFEGEHKNRNLLEVLAWGVLNNGKSSNQLSIRMNALLGASFTQDAKAIPLLLMHLRSSNAWMRTMAVRLAASYGDAPLQDEIERLLKTEKVWYVRLEAIKAAGQLRMIKMRPFLKGLIGNTKTLAEEKTEAIIALVNMYESIDREELKSMVLSPRAGLRELASEIISHLDLREHAGTLISLLQDTSADVRMSALNALGLMRIQKYKGQTLVEMIKNSLNDPAPEVSITAGWLMTLCNEATGLDNLEKWMSDSNPNFRRLAAAALSVTGKNGTALADKILKQSSDPYVRINLALGLIGQRVHVDSACNALYAILSSKKEELWMWDNSGNPLFRSLSPSRVRHIDQVPNYPVVIDQMVHLELLSVLSVMRHAQAQSALRNFLKNQTWGVISAAASTLLQEGDEESLEIVRGLLADPDEKVRFQAALILALIGSDPAAIKVLQEVYPHMERETKVYILEAIAHIGDPESIPFLIEILKEPFQVLRVVAASALIQCLYH
ncbi:MAG TPA: HEAT repeat domain-containing protein [Rhabdochlamydiaceae bacterium]|nr:HEAT repeat domain-containing protein [Rhabdochlamydiaceae bacterium]